MCPIGAQTVRAASNFYLLNQTRHVRVPRKLHQNAAGSCEVIGPVLILHDAIITASRDSGGAVLVGSAVESLAPTHFVRSERIKWTFLRLNDGIFKASPAPLAAEGIMFCGCPSVHACMHDEVY